MRAKVLTLGLICFFVFSHCKRQLPTTPELSLQIRYFTASPSQISAGEFSILSWSVIGAEKVIIDQNIGEVAANGTREVSPVETTVYTLTAYGKTDTVSRTATVNVSAANVVFDGVLWCNQYTASVFVQGIIDNIGNGTAVNIVIHARLFDSENKEIWYGTRLYVCPVEDNSCLEANWNGYGVEVIWDVPYEICIQVEDPGMSRTGWVEVTWDTWDGTCSRYGN